MPLLIVQNVLVRAVIGFPAEYKIWVVISLLRTNLGIRSISK